MGNCNLCGIRAVPGAAGLAEFKPTTSPMGRQEAGRQTCQLCSGVYPSDRVGAAARIQGPFPDVCAGLGLTTVPLKDGGFAIPRPLFLPDGREDPRPFIVRLQYQVGTAVLIGDPADPDSKFTIDHAVEHPEHGVIVYLRDRHGALSAVAVPLPVVVEPVEPEPVEAPEPVRVKGSKGRKPEQDPEPEPVEASEHAGEGERP